MSTITDPIPADYDFLDRLIEQKPIDPPPPLISQWVQGRRVLPPGTPFPGPWDNAKTPYFVEIMDCLSPTSPVQHAILMKSRKIGATTMAENVVGYFIANPSPIEYVTATQELAKDWATSKLPAMLSSCKLQDRITTSNVENAKSRRTGDTTFRKEYFGGVLDITSFEAKKAQRAGDFRVLIRDEIDGVRAQLSSGEGNVLEVNEGHTMSWGDRKKIFDFSSPTTEADSNIWQYFLIGDQRKYHVPCPHCDAGQELLFGNPFGEDATDYGLKPIFNDDGDCVDSYYLCRQCHRQIKNHQKTLMLINGLWVPSRQTSDPTYRSYHLSSLYSPPDMFSWTALYKKYLKSIEDPDNIDDGRRSFENLYLGIPFKESGLRPKIDNPGDRVGDYDRGTIPDGVIYLTMAVDVQSGKKNPRLEMEILGVGLGYRTWSIDYLIFEGSVDHPEDGAWVALHDWIINKSQFTDGFGRYFRPMIGFVDAGDGNMMETVYQFCAAHKGLFPSKGQQTIRASHEKKDSGDDPLRNEMKYGFTRIGQSDRFLYRISTNHYKRIIYANLQVERVEGDGAQRAHFCDFPNDYGQEYFDGLLSEELRADGAYYKIHTRNEPLDLRVYALAASDVWLDDQVRRAQENWKKQHPEATKDDLAKINGYQALEHLKRVLDSQIMARR